MQQVMKFFVWHLVSSTTAQTDLACIVTHALTNFDTDKNKKDAESKPQLGAFGPSKKLKQLFRNLDIIWYLENGGRPNRIILCSTMFLY